ncbi:MAG: hydroxyacid dehydrogenase [Candidatus Aenigmarchaeota archaeon]|nr:hydroxyacid dehydrogenase [Candidatus Aenigmarchaeota archaeon]
MKIAFFETKKWERNFLKRKLKNHKIKFFEERLNPDNVEEIKNFDVISVFIYSKINKTILQRLPKLKLITTRSTGYDHIDLKECKKKGITVCNVPFYGENTVAEHTFGLILSLSRNICKSYIRTINGNYSTEGLKGFDLKDKTLGVMGAGHIGLHVIRIAKGFGMNVLAYDVKQDMLLSEVLGFKYVSLGELLKKSDIITLHVPHNKYTHHLINRKNIKLVKRGAILINTSRGAVVETEALIEGLNKKILHGVGLDVIEGEEVIKEEKLLEEKKREYMKDLIKNQLLNRENVVFTPHIAFYSQEALERILETTTKNINSFVSGNPENVIE